MGSEGRLGTISGGWQSNGKSIEMAKSCGSPARNIYKNQHFFGRLGSSGRSSGEFLETMVGWLGLGGLCAGHAIMRSCDGGETPQG